MPASFTSTLKVAERPMKPFFSPKPATTTRLASPMKQRLLFDACFFSTVEMTELEDWFESGALMLEYPVMTFDDDDGDDNDDGDDVNNNSDVTMTADTSVITITS